MRCLVKTDDAIKFVRSVVGSLGTAGKLVYNIEAEPIESAEGVDCDHVWRRFNRHISDDGFEPMDIIEFCYKCERVKPKMKQGEVIDPVGSVKTSGCEMTSTPPLTEEEIARLRNGGPYLNTDRALFREGDFYSPSVHVTKEGAIGMNCGGTVIVATIRAWHDAMTAYTITPTEHSQSRLAEAVKRVEELEESLGMARELYVGCSCTPDFVCHNCNLSGPGAKGIKNEPIN